MLITIFTPTYNRSHTLQRLYDSLITQSNKNFEWIIVDDGSVDNTEELIISFISESKISIVYCKQENAGKHIAINKGVELAKGEYFYIVDSDDYLPLNAIQIIENKISLINKENTIGVIGLKQSEGGKLLGRLFPKEDILLNHLDRVYKYKLVGDFAEVIKTEVIKDFTFPKISNEKFCTEGLLWNRLAKRGYVFLCFNDVIYYGDYLEGGLTMNSVKIRKRSPKGTMLFYEELQDMKIPFIYKIRANINYWRFSYYSKNTFYKSLKKIGVKYSIIGLPISLLFYLRDK